MELIAVAAVSENGVIGDDGEIPWPSVPADRRQYRERVAESPVVLGRRTFESMLDDLPGAVQIVLTSDPTRRYEVDTAYLVDSARAAIERAESYTADRAYVLGGGGVYATFMPFVDRLLISRIPGEYAGDTVFPPIDDDTWVLVDEHRAEGYVLETWERRDPDGPE